MERARKSYNKLQGMWRHMLPTSQEVKRRGGRGLFAGAVKYIAIIN